MKPVSACLFFIALLILPATSISETKHTPMETVVASADSWKNMRGSAGSLKFESARLLRRADETLSENGTKVLTLRSVPQKFLKAYGDEKKCDQKMKETQSSPFSYGPLSFDSVDKLGDWFSAFSRGSGKEGSDLYQRCDGACSPQYTLLISKPNGNLSVTAQAVCGPARDKDDNNYVMTLRAQ